MEPTKLMVEYHSTNGELTDELREKIEHRLERLTRGHSDITSATVATQPITSDGSPKEYKVRILVHQRRGTTTAIEKAESLNSAIAGALDVVERQVRERRDRRREVSRKAIDGI